MRRPNNTNSNSITRRALQVNHNMNSRGKVTYCRNIPVHQTEGSEVVRGSRPQGCSSTMSRGTWNYSNGDEERVGRERVIVILEDFSYHVFFFLDPRLYAITSSTKCRSLYIFVHQRYQYYLNFRLFHESNTLHHSTSYPPPHSPQLQPQSSSRTKLRKEVRSMPWRTKLIALHSKRTVSTPLVRSWSIDW